MGNVTMEASQINYRGGASKMSVEQALKETSGEAAAIAQLQEDVGNLQDTKANLITIAPVFSEDTAYDPGDLVYYNGLTYRCVNAHEGEWDADDFSATTISNEIDSLKSGLTSKEPLGGTNTGNKLFNVGDKLYLFTDNEGGNIVIKSPTNIAYEADAYNDSFRIWTAKSGVVKSISWDGMSDVDLNAMPKIYHGTVTSDGTGVISVPNATNSLIVLVGNDVKSYHLEYNNPNVFILRNENNFAVTDTSVEIMAMYI